MALRCKFLTLRKTQCSRNSKFGCDGCWQHEGMSPEKKVNVWTLLPRCRAETLKRHQCKMTAKYENRWCHFHQYEDSRTVFPRPMHWK